MRQRRARLAQARRAAGHTQESLAEALGLDRSTVVRWERGETQPQPWIRPRLARMLNLSPGQLDDVLHDPTPAAGRAPRSWTAVLSPTAGSGESHSDVVPLPPAQADDHGASLSDLMSTTIHQRQLYHQMPATAMLPYAQAHLATLQRVLGQPGRSTQHRVVASLAQEAAGLTAWLQHDAGSHLSPP